MKTLMALTVSLLALSTLTVASRANAANNEPDPQCYAPLKQIEVIHAVTDSEALAIETGSGDVSMIEVADMKDGAHPVINVKFVGDAAVTVYDSHITCTGEVREFKKRVEATKP